MFLSGGVEFSTQNLLQKGHPFILRRLTGNLGTSTESSRAAKLLTPEQANEKVKNWVAAHPGWKTTGKAIEARIL